MQCNSAQSNAVEQCSAVQRCRTLHITTHIDKYSAEHYLEYMYSYEQYRVNVVQRSASPDCIAQCNTSQHCVFHCALHCALHCNTLYCSVFIFVSTYSIYLWFICFLWSSVDELRGPNNYMSWPMCVQYCDQHMEFSRIFQQSYGPWLVLKFQSLGIMNGFW